MQTYTPSPPARLNFTGEGCSFYIQDNPLIHAIEDKLQAAKTSSTKLLFDYLKTEEYKEWVNSLYVLVARLSNFHCMYMYPISRPLS